MRFIIDSAHEFKAEVIRFPCGEVGIKLPQDLPLQFSQVVVDYDWVEYKNEGILLIGQFFDALKRVRPHLSPLKILSVPYLPYARQDRACSEGESFALKVFADIINSYKFDMVFTADNHSEVATALINNCINISTEKYRAGQQEIDNIFNRDQIFIAPDIGSVKKVRKLADIYQKNMVRCDKARNPHTGKILFSEVLDKELVETGSRFLVIDDICSYGGTFIGIAKAIRKINPDARLELYITHGFFDGGLEILLEHYDNIYTTDSVCTLTHPNLHII